MRKRHEINFDIRQKILHISEKNDLCKIGNPYYHGKYQIIYKKIPMQEMTANSGSSDHAFR